MQSDYFFDKLSKLDANVMGSIPGAADSNLTVPSVFPVAGPGFELTTSTVPFNRSYYKTGHPSKY